MQTGQNKMEHQGTGATKAFEYDNARSGFVAITEKNEKQYASLLTTNYFRHPRKIFPCIAGNPAVQCDNQV